MSDILHIAYGTQTGTAEELASDEQVRKVYLGQNFELKKKTIDF